MRQDKDAVRNQVVNMLVAGRDTVGIDFSL